MRQNSLLYILRLKSYRYKNLCIKYSAVTFISILHLLFVIIVIYQSLDTEKTINRYYQSIASIRVRRCMFGAKNENKKDRGGAEE